MPPPLPLPQEEEEEVERAAEQAEGEDACGVLVDGIDDAGSPLLLLGEKKE